MYRVAATVFLDACMWPEDWLTGFFKRHRNIALRTPEATSPRRAMNFNRANVTLFNDNLERLYLREALAPSRIWNLDETGCTTVQKPSSQLVSNKSAQSCQSKGDSL